MRLLAMISVFLAALAPLPAFAETDPVTGMEFVYVKGGCYPMGDASGEGDGDERPVHEVCVSDFLIGKYKVTQGQWEKVMGSNPSRFRKGGDYPVENVSWNDVEGFIVRLNGKTGRKYRLPTEAEWEYAARSGGRNEMYAGTGSETELEKYAWYYVNSGNETHPVGKKLPNRLGLYDMTGILWEWCADWYAERYYARSPKKDPKGPKEGWFRSLRGGSWDTDARNARIASRYWAPPEIGNAKRGFRLVLPASRRK